MNAFLFPSASLNEYMGFGVATILLTVAAPNPETILHFNLTCNVNGFVCIDILFVPICCKMLNSCR